MAGQETSTLLSHKRERHGESKANKSKARTTVSFFNHAQVGSTGRLMLSQDTPLPNGMIIKKIKKC